MVENAPLSLLVPWPVMPVLTLDALVTRHVGPVSLEIGAGECVALSGGSGSGKSLLLRAVADLDPHGGTARLDEVAAEQLDAPHWRRRVGLLAAESQWWADRVGDHFPSDEKADADWTAALAERLGFAPGVWEWQVSRLSSGERQRLALARLLAHRPAALLLDEPTANLDADNGRRVEALVADYRGERAAPVLWVGHDPAQLQRVAGRRFTLRDGALAEGD